MKIYRLDVDIDGFGGKEQDKYFYSFKDACKSLSVNPGFYYNAEKDEWDIEMVKETRVGKTDDSLQLIGIPFRDDEREDDDPWYINWARAAITPLDINGECHGKVYVLGKMNGYNTWLASAMDPQPVYTGATICNQFTRLLITFSKNYARKIARSKYKRYARIWNDKEYEKHCSIINGGGEDYISIREYNIEGSVK